MVGIKRTRRLDRPGMKVFVFILTCFIFWIQIDINSELFFWVGKQICVKYLHYGVVLHSYLPKRTPNIFLGITNAHFKVQKDLYGEIYYVSPLWEVDTCNTTSSYMGQLIAWSIFMRPDSRDWLCIDFKEGSTQKILRKAMGPGLWFFFFKVFIFLFSTYNKFLFLFFYIVYIVNFFFKNL